MKFIKGLQQANLHLRKRDRVVSSSESTNDQLTMETSVLEIVAAVKARGDEAVRFYTEKFDKVDLQYFEVRENEIAAALSKTPKSLIDALQTASVRIKAFHERSMPSSWHDADEGYGEQFSAVGRAGIYIPGGSAAYPSSVLMTAIPARVAGVPEIIVCTPPNGADGPDPGVLAACYLCGVDRVFAVGGAQAIAGMAYGTASIPAVNLICGPGNRFVTLAKKMVYGDVGIDGLYGPTETIIIADDTADAKYCAADLLAQAEHDVFATPILITTSGQMVTAVESQLQLQLKELSRSDIARASLENNGLIVQVDAISEALEIANIFAPEHLCLLVERPETYLPQVHNAGAVFLGHRTPEVLGDFVAGPSHVMPTGGTAKFSSPLGVNQFLKVTSTIRFTNTLLNDLSNATSTIANYEGFTAHAAAIDMRISNE